MFSQSSAREAPSSVIVDESGAGNIPVEKNPNANVRPQFAAGESSAGEKTAPSSRSNDDGVTSVNEISALAPGEAKNPSRISHEHVAIDSDSQKSQPQHSETAQVDLPFMSLSGLEKFGAILDTWQTVTSYNQPLSFHTMKALSQAYWRAQQDRPEMAKMLIDRQWHGEFTTL